MKVFTTIVVCTLAAIGCSKSPKSSYGFTLPDGNVETGKLIFESYLCHECHTVSGTEFAELDFAADKQVKIGGPSTRIQTYGELVTSIINPSHKLAAGYQPGDVSDDGESKMTNYNEVMTVGELIHLTAFLQSRYELQPYEPTDYDMYFYGP